MTAPAGEHSGAATYAEWLQHRSRWLKEPFVRRLVACEQPRPTPPEFADEVSRSPFLSYHAGVGPESRPTRLQIVPGRWPQKKAVRLDRDHLAGPVSGFPDSSFTVTAWLRILGPGSVRGDSVPTGGTLLSLGGGYWDGWRLTYRYPDKVLGFEIGRPKPASAVSVGAGPVAEHLWHHVAATWDGREMRLYLDGALAGSTPFAGPLTPPGPDGKFRIGVAGFGWGSVVMEVDEVAVCDGALEPAMIEEQAQRWSGIPAAFTSHFSAGEAAMRQRAFARAVAEYAAALDLCGATGAGADAVRLCLAQALMGQQQYTAAGATFSKLLETHALPEAVRRSALASLPKLVRLGAQGLSRRACEAALQTGSLTAREQLDLRLHLARLCRDEGDPSTARDQFRRALESPELAPRQKLELRLQLGHTAFVARNFAGARAEYAAVAAAPDAPPHFKCYAALRIAQSYAAEGNAAAARSEFQKISATAEFPAHHRAEAAEYAQELERRTAGQPARDPAASRLRLPPRPTLAREFFVAPDGSDTNPGTREAPFATLERARDAIRALKRDGALAAGGVAVTLRAGDYARRETFRLTAEDAGTERAPVVYRAETKGTARLRGGVRVSGFGPITDETVLARLPTEARGKVVQADLKAQGLTEYGQLHKRGFGASVTPLLEVFFNGKALTPARWPNSEFVKTGKVVEPGSGSARRGAIFHYEGDRPARWLQAPDAWLFGYWHYLWADGTLPVAAIHPAARQIQTAQPYTYGGGVKEGMPYYVFNLLEEIDAPGEWYLDRSQGRLHLWPPSDPGTATIEISMLAAPMVQMDDTAHIALEGLVLELGRAQGVIMNRTTNCLLAACTLRQLGGDAVVIEQGRGSGLLGCDLYELARGGARVRGGDRGPLIPGDHFVENCHVHDFSRVDRTYTPAVWMDGVGNRIAHNLFHDSPGHAIRLEGNDHVIEFNDIHHVVLETDDQGGLDMHFNPSYRGNVIRYNFWHDLGSGHVPCGQAGVRLDDAISGVLVYGNVFYRCAHGLFGAVQIHGGKDNVLDNNLFVDCPRAVSFTLWSNERWSSFLGEAARRGDVFTNALYLVRYPALVQLAERPFVNSVWRNLAVNCGGFLTRDQGLQDLMDNVVTDRDPGFVNAAGRDFTLRPDARIFGQIGFRPIPFAEIGLYPGEHRASWPPAK